MLDFGIVHVGREVQQFVSVHNPSDMPITVQLVEPTTDDFHSDALRSEASGGEDDDLPETFPGSPFYLPADGGRVLTLEPKERSTVGPITFAPSLLVSF